MIIVKVDFKKRKLVEQFGICDSRSGKVLLSTRVKADRSHVELTFNFDSTLVISIRANQTNGVIEILDRADTLVAAIVAVVLSVAHLCLIHALLIVANVHVVAVYAPLAHFVIIELLVRLERTG